MPGLIIYRRRWSIGSDDLLIPGLILAILHTIWLIILVVYLSVVHINKEDLCQVEFFQQLIGYFAVWILDLGLELAIIFISTRGTVFNDSPRSKICPLIYLKQVMWAVELAWCCTGVIWIHSYYTRSECSMSYKQKNIILGLVICNLLGLLILLLVFWCSYDSAGRSWLKLKKFQERAAQNSGKFKESRYSGIHRRSGGASRNWRHRQVRRENEKSWDGRCRMLFCCAGRDNKSKTSFAEIAGLLSEFFRDLDVVPTDVLVGLVLLRQRQQAARQRTISQPTNNVYDFLSGVKVTPETKFVALNNPKELDKLRETVHYMYFALAAYGWPMYLLHNKTVSVHKAAWRLFSGVRCCRSNCCVRKCESGATVLEDNCCMCNYSALRQVCLDSTEIVYVTYHVEVGETPFFIGVDFEKQTIVISIRGTLSIQDILTDLNAESEILPLQIMDEDMKGHKGMVQAAAYIYDKLMKENLLDRAFNWRPASGTQNFPLVCVGHSLGGGTAAILTILLRQHYPNTTCYAYSPPGGLLSENAMVASREYMTSVVVGKDVVARLGLHQMETLRHDLIATVRTSKKNKWDTLAKSLLCSKIDNQGDEEAVSPTAAINVHPLDSTINLSVHQPLYPPGNIIHIVRHHPNDKKYANKEPVFQAVWADNYDFDQVLISKCMIQDHMPDMVLDALEKACRRHAWHAVYTSAIGGTQVEANQHKDDTNSSPLKLKDDISSCPFPLQTEIIKGGKGVARRLRDVEIENVVTTQPEVCNKYERILHENHGDHLYTVHHQGDIKQQQQQHRTQYVHVQHDQDLQQEQIQTSFLEDSPKRSQACDGNTVSTSEGATRSSTVSSASPSGVRNHVTFSMDQQQFGDQQDNQKSLQALDNVDLGEVSKSFIQSVRVNNQNTHSLLSKEKTLMLHGHSKNSCKKIQVQQIDEKTTVQIISEITTLQSNIEKTSSYDTKNVNFSTIKCVTNSNLQIEESAPNIKLKSSSDILSPSIKNEAGQSNIKIRIHQNGSLEAPVASPEPVSQTDSSHSSRISQHSFRFEGANKVNQVDPAQSTSLYNKSLPQECTSIYNQSLPELFNIVQEQIEADLLNTRWMRTAPPLLLKPCHSSSDITENFETGAHQSKGGSTQSQLQLKPPPHKSKDFRKIRTPSDIFSFYDISREEATTV